MISSFPPIHAVGEHSAGPVTEIITGQARETGR